VADAIEHNQTSVKPSPPEKTEINLAKKSWGEGPLAELAKQKSGRDYMFVEVCSTCLGTMLVSDEMEKAQEKKNLYCQTCLRIRAN
jgi:hypothetical protein